MLSSLRVTFFRQFSVRSLSCLLSGCSLTFTALDGKQGGHTLAIIHRSWRGSGHARAASAVSSLSARVGSKPRLFSVLLAAHASCSGLKSTQMDVEDAEMIDKRLESTRPLRSNKGKRSRRGWRLMMRQCPICAASPLQVACSWVRSHAVAAAL